MDGATFKHVFLAVVLNTFYINVVDAVNCYYAGSGITRRHSGYLYCSTSCCGTYNNRYCCEHAGLSTLGIIGIVMAVLVGASVVVCIVCCRRRRSTPGHIIRSQQQQQQQQQQAPAIRFGVARHPDTPYNGTAPVLYPGNVNFPYAGPPMSNGINGNGSESLPQELNAGTLANPPAYESISGTPADEPPKYSSIYNP